MLRIRLILVDPHWEKNGSGSVDPHVFANPDPGIQNLADPTDPDPTDPDPKHWKKKTRSKTEWFK